jgi:hypothetical protein
MNEVLRQTPGKPQPGRRTTRRIFENEAYRRIVAGNAPASLSEFAAQLAAWFKDTHPAATAPTTSFVEAAIRDTGTAVMS